MEELKAGFIGLGIMGEAMALNLIKNKISLNIYNRTYEKVLKLIENGAIYLKTPKEIIKNSNIVFLMLSDDNACDEIFNGKEGIIEGLCDISSYRSNEPNISGKFINSGSKKYIINFSTISPDFSINLYKGVTEAGAYYLEAPVIGSKIPAIEAKLIIVTAGDNEAFEKSKNFLYMMGSKIIYTGEIPNASQIKIVNNMIMGAMISAYSEGIVMARKLNLDLELVYDILNSGAFSNSMFAIKGKNMLKNNFETNFPYKHMQKDLGYGLMLSEKNKYFLPNLAVANETFKLGLKKYGDEDMSAIYKTIADSNK